MNTLQGAALAASLGLASPAFAAQPVVVTAPGAPLLPVVAYEIDYATGGKAAGSSGSVYFDTVVSIGLPAGSTSTSCPAQVAWYDWNGALAGVSGPFSLTPGVTVEFTTSVNSLNPTEYPPFTENIFSNLTAPFEGHAVVLESNNCVSPRKLRIDAEFVTATIPPSGTAPTLLYKSIAVTNRAGVTGY